MRFVTRQHTTGTEWLSCVRHIGFSRRKKQLLDLIYTAEESIEKGE